MRANSFPPSSFLHPKEMSEGAVKVKKWRAVGYWTWDSIDQVDTCAICKNLLMEICIECMADQSEECTIAWGVCNHKYHFHCISRWLAAHSTCPLGLFSFLQ